MLFAHRGHFQSYLMDQHSSGELQMAHKNLGLSFFYFDVPKEIMNVLCNKPQMLIKANV